MTTRAWLIALATGLAGFVAGWLLAMPSTATPADDPVAATVQARGSPIEVSPAASQHGGVSLDDLRRVVREELAAAGNRPAPAEQGAAVSVASEPPTPAQSAALARASLVLDGAISRRQFTEADVDALRDEFHQLSPGQQAEIMQRYAMAVNQGRIVPTTDRLPF